METEVGGIHKQGWHRTGVMGQTGIGAKGARRGVYDFPRENRSVLGSTVLQLDMDGEGQSVQGWPMWS